MNGHVSAIATSLCVAWAVVASADGVVVSDIHRLDGSTAFYKPPLTNVASVQRMAFWGGVRVHFQSTGRIRPRGSCDGFASGRRMRRSAVAASIAPM